MPQTETCGVLRNRVDEEPEEDEAEPDFEDEAAAEEFRQRKVRCAAWMLPLVLLGCHLACDSCSSGVAASEFLLCDVICPEWALASSKL